MIWEKCIIQQPCFYCSLFKKSNITISIYLEENIMLINDEINLLIKSKYPVVYFEAIDESFAIKQLKATAKQLNIIFYLWSLREWAKERTIPA